MRILTKEALFRCPKTCENCKAPIQQITETEMGDPIDPNTPWEQYLCEDCYDEIWELLLENACGVCRTEQCLRGRECWVNPFPRIMYLCYVAPKVGQKAKIPLPEPEACDDMFEEEPDDECEYAFVCMSKAECPDHPSLLSCSKYKKARQAQRTKIATEKGQRKLLGVEIDG